MTSAIFCLAITECYCVDCAPFGDDFAVASKDGREYVFHVSFVTRSYDAFLAAMKGMNAALQLGLQ